MNKEFLEFSIIQNKINTYKTIFGSPAFRKKAHTNSNKISTHRGSFLVNVNEDRGIRSIFCGGGRLAGRQAKRERE